MNYPEQRDDAPPPRVAATDGESFRRLGYELVMRHGTALEIAAARARLKEILAIQRQTAGWMREQWMKRSAA